MLFELDEAVCPEEALSLWTATRWAIAKLGDSATREVDRDRVAEAVLAVARFGYARSDDGHFDDVALAEAALTRFRNLQHYAEHRR